MNWNPVDYRIFETISGSQMYGTSTPESDVDYRGVVIPPTDALLLDPFQGFEQKDSGFVEEDRVLYSMWKFFKLCGDGNPNIVELLFAPDENWIIVADPWFKIIGNRSIFLSKKVKYTFTGYAISQLHKLQQHRKWFIDPPDHKPTRKEFNLSDVPLISGEGLNAVSNINFDLFQPEMREYIHNEADYRQAKESWDKYQSWLVGRNKKRQDLEAKFGYDTKCALHLFRLMFEGRELLLEGKITFPLKDREELLRIKNGKYSYEEIISWSENLEKEFNVWYEASSLPQSPDWKEIETMYLHLIREENEI